MLWATRDTACGHENFDAVTGSLIFATSLRRTLVVAERSAQQVAVVAGDSHGQAFSTISSQGASLILQSHSEPIVHDIYCLTQHRKNGRLQTEFGLVPDNHSSFASLLYPPLPGSLAPLLYPPLPGSLVSLLYPPLPGSLTPLLYPPLPGSLGTSRWTSIAPSSDSGLELIHNLIPLTLDRGFSDWGGDSSDDAQHHCDGDKNNS